MLSELHIKNFALIDEAYLHLGKGLNVLTGETGAGKTIIVEAMNLLLGKRADPVLIGSRAEEALVEGSFLQDSTDLVVSRVVSREGKNKCYINGKLATVAMLQEMGEALVDFHGQHEHQSVLKVAMHLDYLDRFGGGALLELAEQVGEAYRQLKGLRDEMEGLQKSERERIGRLDLLSFQIDEIAKANLVSGEEEGLERERLILQNAEKLSQAVDAARQALIQEEVTGQGLPGAAENIEAARQGLSSIAEIDEVPKRIADKLEEMGYQVSELASELRSYAERIDFSPERLDEVESRLSVMSLLKKKYGDTTQDILRHKDEAEAEHARLKSSTTRLKDLEAEERDKRAAGEKKATKLTSERKKVAKRLEEAVERELDELDLKRCRFKVNFGREEELGSRGQDQVEFLISPNPGEPLKPLVKIASGGEVSRIMLALKIVLIKADPVPMLIFDEIDSGVGGKTAAEVGKKLAYLASSHQIVVITHLPQIASFADRHFFVSKHAREDVTETKVGALDQKGKLEELSRMLSGGAPSDITKKHAQELLHTAAEAKTATAAKDRRGK